MLANTAKTFGSLGDQECDVWSTKVGICFKSSSEMSDRPFEGITTYRKGQNFQVLDFNQLNILFGKEQNFQNIIFFWLFYEIIPRAVGGLEPLSFGKCSCAQRGLLYLGNSDLVFSLSGAAENPDQLQT